MDGQNGRSGNDLGDEIRNVVNQALNNGDFSNLNNQIRNSVNSAVEEIKASIYKEGMRTSNRVRYTQNPAPHATYRNVKYAQGSNVNKIIGTDKAAIKRNAKAEIRADIRAGLINKGNEGGARALFIVGIVFLSIAGIAILDSLADGMGIDWDSLIMGVPGAICFTLGFTKRQKIKRLMGYYNLAKEKGYASIDELARVNGKTKGFIVKDIYKMIAEGMLPQAHIDETETYFILDSKTNDLYENMMKSHEQQQKEQEVKEEKKAEEDAANKVSETVAQGRRYIQAINEANAAIPGEEITKKLDDLSLIMDRIFSFVEEHPEEEGSMRKFMDYYLPTTLKLVRAYRDFDADPVQGDNITASKHEIEETLDTINNAFKRLYDDLYEDTAMDISTDINVLNTLFAQDGLTKEELKNN